MTPADGEEYLRAFPKALWTSTYVGARLVP